MSKHNIGRRTILRGLLGGAAVTLGLPPLEAMFNANGDAYAEDGKLPIRYGVWFWGNGADLPYWTPDDEGPDWKPKYIMEPLAAHKQRITVVGGLHNKFDNVAHHCGRASMLSGSFDPDDGTWGSPVTPTSDQIVADHIQGDTLIRSLQLGVSRRGFSNSVNKSSMAWVDPHSPLPAEHSPLELWKYLFGMGVGEQDTTGNAARSSMLDVVGADTEALAKRLGASDRIRLEKHLAGVRALEKRLAAMPNACTVPPEQEDYPYDASAEKLVEINAVMSELLALALACDMTRVFNYKFTGMQTDTFFWQTAAKEGMHTMTHEKSMRAMVNDATRFMMSQLAVTIDRLAEIDEGAGKLVDNLAMYCTTEISVGPEFGDHSIRDMPILVVGSAGGRLKSGIHWRSKTGENVSKLPLTLMRAVGAPVEKFGWGEGQVTETISEIEAG